jgi:hypothetical protein
MADSTAKATQSDAIHLYGERMRLRASVIIASILTFALAGCATPTIGAGGAPPASTRSAIPSPEPSESTLSVVASGSTDAQARAQARAWLAEATLPPSAVPAPATTAFFSSYTSWPCGPVAELNAYWTIPGKGVVETANWLQGHPIGDLIPTRPGPVDDSPGVTTVTIGYVPAHGAEQGVVYTVEKTPEGVAVRAEIAAQTATASCPPVPGGGQWGEPGDG